MKAVINTKPFAVAMLVAFLLKASATTAQKPSTKTTVARQTHIELTGYPGKDSVTVYQLLKAGQLSLADHRLTILSFRYTLVGPCIGAGVYFNNSENDRFREEDHPYLRLLRPNDRLLIDSITARDSNGNRLKLKTGTLVIIKSDH